MKQLIRCPFVNSNVPGSDWLWRIILSVWFRNPANQLIYMVNLPWKWQGFIHVDCGWESDFLPLAFWVIGSVHRKSSPGAADHHLFSRFYVKNTSDQAAREFPWGFWKPNKNHPTLKWPGKRPQRKGGRIRIFFLEHMCQLMKKNHVLFACSKICFPDNSWHLYPPRKALANTACAPPGFYRTENWRLQTFLKVRQRSAGHKICMSLEQWKKPWLVGLYRGLYCLVIWGL